MPAITIPDKAQIRRTTSEINHSFPNCLASVAWTNPTPLAIDTAGAGYTGQPKVKPAFGVAGRLSYVGMSHEPSVAVGKAVCPQRNLIIAGYSGVSIGLPVFIDDVGSDNSSTASGLTHAQPSGSLTHIETPQEAAVSATQKFELVVPFAGTISAVKIGVATTVATDDTNFWSFGLVNQTQTLTAVDSTAAANTNKATGGSAITAYTPRALTLSGTPANLVVAAGDVLEFTATKAAAAVNLVEFLVDLALTPTDTAQVGRPIGIGWGTDRILFY